MLPINDEPKTFYAKLTPRAFAGSIPRDAVLVIAIALVSRLTRATFVLLALAVLLLLVLHAFDLYQRRVIVRRDGLELAHKPGLFWTTRRFIPWTDITGASVSHGRRDFDRCIVLRALPVIISLPIGSVDDPDALRLCIERYAGTTSVLGIALNVERPDPAVGS